MDKNIGRKLDGRYEITELIGVGGMADVYKATDIMEDRVVAVKILKNEFSDNEDFVRRFRNESKAIAVLSHPNIVKIYDVGFTDKIQFIVMEYIDGITLKEFMEQQGVLKWKDTIHFIIQILRALQHAHDRGIVHRDIKPQNIMLFSDGTIKVMDFGIARFAREEGKTISDKAIGSVHYISPEQARGDITDEKSDIYSVGVMMYEMLTGVKPFDADNPVTVALMHMQNEPKPPREVNDSIPEGLEEIVLRAMQKEASKRYQSASEMIKDIEEFKKNPSIVFEYKYLSEKTQYYNAGAARAAAAEAHGNDRQDDKSYKKIKTKVRTRDLPVPSHKNEVYDDDYDNENEDEEGAEPVSKSSYFVVILSAIAAGILIIVVAFIAIMIITRITKRGEVAYVPDLVGYSYQEVKTAYEKSFTLTVDDQVYSAEYPEGAIISQKPQANEQYIVGEGEVKVVVSKGPQMIQISNVYDLDANTAQSMLADDGFNVKIMSTFDDTVEKGIVIMTDPAKGAKAEKGSTVYLYVSRGPEEQDVIVPDTVGYNVDAAKTLLGDKFNVKIANEDSSEPEGTVISQSIPAIDEEGQSNIVPINSSITLTVSSGIAPEAEVAVTFKVPSGLSGNSATFKCYINGHVVGTENIDNIAYATSVTVKIKGSDVQDVMLEAVNNSDNKSATIGQYSVDFVNNTVTETSFDNDTFAGLFTEETQEESTTSQDNSNDTNTDDDDFWNEILGGN